MATDIREPSLEIPPLRPGDRLTRAEFERRWEAMPQVKRAELIDGEVIMTPVSRDHGTPHFSLNGLLAFYQMQTPGVEGADNTSLRLDDENMPQPDGLLRILETHGGRSRFDDDGYYTSGPELLVEIARSTSAFDLGAKRELYQRYQIPEYIVWNVTGRSVEWFILTNGVYERGDQGSDQVIRSDVFPGLWIATNALIAKDAAKLLAIAQQGLGSPEHAAFVAELRQRGG